MATENMTNRKPTKREMFTEILNILNEAERPELAEVVQKEIDHLNSRSGPNKKLTEAQQKNIQLMDAIFEVLKNSDKPMSISQLLDMKDENAELAGIKSNQHCNSLLIKMRKEGRVQRIEVKDGTVFTIAGREVTAADEGSDENVDEVVE